MKIYSRNSLSVAFFYLKIFIILGIEKIETKEGLLVSKKQRKFYNEEVNLESGNWVKKKARKPAAFVLVYGFQSWDNRVAVLDLPVKIP